MLTFQIKFCTNRYLHTVGRFLIATCDFRRIVAILWLCVYTARVHNTSYFNNYDWKKTSQFSMIRSPAIPCESGGRLQNGLRPFLIVRKKHARITWPSKAVCIVIYTCIYVGLIRGQILAEGDRFWQVDFSRNSLGDQIWQPKLVRGDHLSVGPIWSCCTINAAFS